MERKGKRLLAMGIGRHTGNGHQKMGWNGFLGVDEQILIRWGIFYLAFFVSFLILLILLMKILFFLSPLSRWWWAF